MSTSPPLDNLLWMRGGQDSHNEAKTGSHTAQDHQRTLIRQSLIPLPLFKLSVCSARSHVCLIQQEGSPIQGILIRFSTSCLLFRENSYITLVNHFKSTLTISVLCFFSPLYAAFCPTVADHLKRTNRKEIRVHKA